MVVMTAVLANPGGHDGMAEIAIGTSGRVRCLRRRG
jgi:hypothetical protein